jgi:hypothetical protein
MPACPRLIGLRGKSSGQCLAQLRNHRRDAIAQPSPDPGGQAMRRRAPGVAEIVEIDPVIGRRPFGERLVEIAERGCHSPGPVLADDEDIEPDARHGEAEIERLAGPRMAAEVEDVDSLGR